MSENRRAAGRILVVDDEPTFRGLIATRLRERYDVTEAESGKAALELLACTEFDLVLTDINMPEMMGYELIAEIQKREIPVKTAVITAWSIEACLDFAIRHGIGNIITKTVPFDLKGLDTAVNKLLSEDIFGVEQYMMPGTPVAEVTFNTTAAVHGAREAVMAGLQARQLDEETRMLLQLVLDEAISNAAYHSEGYEKGSVHILKNHVEIHFGSDDEKMGISIVDSAGQLTKETILTKLDACLHVSEEEIFRESGRGLFLMRSFVDRFIINIKKGVRTEIILLLYFQKQEERGDRPLLIHEI